MEPSMEQQNSPDAEGIYDSKKNKNIITFFLWLWLFFYRRFVLFLWQNNINTE